MKNPRELTQKIQKSLTDKEKAPAQSHSYAKVPNLKVSSKTPSPLPTKKKDLVGANPVSKEWSPEVSQTAACSCHMESNSPPGAHLIPERVHRWKIKNHSSIVRKMQSQAQLPASDLPEHISVMSSDKEQQDEKEEKKQDELWRDLMKNQEERHFRLTRITNFFT